MECGRAKTARISRDVLSRHVPGGKTIAQIAAESGVSLNTVYVRWMRGWPIARLGAPIAKCWVKREQWRRKP
jgi:hypothetical protein